MLLVGQDQSWRMVLTVSTVPGSVPAPETRAPPGDGLRAAEYGDDGPAVAGRAGSIRGACHGSRSPVRARPDQRHDRPRPRALAHAALVGALGRALHRGWLRRSRARVA